MMNKLTGNTNRLGKYSLAVRTIFFSEPMEIKFAWEDARKKYVTENIVTYQKYMAACFHYDELTGQSFLYDDIYFDENKGIGIWS